MALQFKNAADVNGCTNWTSCPAQTGGYQGEQFGVTKGNQSWTDVTNNTYSFEFFYRDSDTANNNNSSRVVVTGYDTISNYSHDPSTNSVSCRVKTVITSIRRDDLRGSPGAATRRISVYAGQGGSFIRSFESRPNQAVTMFSGNLVVRDENVTIAKGQSWSRTSSVYIDNWAVGYSGDKYHDYIKAGTFLKNTFSGSAGTPRISISCGAVANSTKGQVRLGTLNYNCTTTGCTQSYSITWYSDSSYRNAVAYGTGQKDLAANTTYYIRATINNGYYTNSATCRFTTLAPSNPFGYKYVTDQVSTIMVNVNCGGNACSVSTKLYIREQGTSAWKEVKTLDTCSQEKVQLRNLIERGKKYEAITKSTNCSGTYTSGIYQFEPPAGDSVIGTITMTDASLEPSGFSATLEYCYKVEAFLLEPISDSNPITSHIEYRAVGQQDWERLDDALSNKSPDTLCGKITGLACDTSYELRSYQTAGDAKSYSNVVVVAMPACADVYNCVCANLEYMTELICQDAYVLRNGNTKVYANCQTKKLCDSYSFTPTLETILSRIVRYFQAVKCILCAMEGAISFGAGEDDDVFTATEVLKPGQWVKLSQEAKEDDQSLISDKAACEAVARFVESAFTPIGNYQYFYPRYGTLSSIPVPTDVATGDKTIYSTTKIAKWNGTEWEADGEIEDPASFDTINVIKGPTPNAEYYWFNDKWNRIDTSTQEIEERLNELSQEKGVFNYGSTNNDFIVMPITSTDEEIRLACAEMNALGHNVVVYLTEEAA